MTYKEAMTEVAKDKLVRRPLWLPGTFVAAAYYDRETNQYTPFFGWAASEGRQNTFQFLMISRPQIGSCMSHAKKDEKIPCGNLDCNIRMSCARANDKDYIGEPGKLRTGDWQLFNLGRVEGVDCAFFVIRAALGGSDPGELPAGRRGRRHNEHVPPRTTFPGSTELFGHLFGGKGIRARDRNKPASNSLPKRPGLMVRRHIKHGHNIKEED